jgi:predicted short-subunit dehydrogenase-like oxidoreductase (DUF2520 family)
MAGSRLRVIGAGRAGRALALALAQAGWRVGPVLGRGADVTGAAAGVDLLVIATPDAAVSSVAAGIEPVETTVVAHLAGSLGLTVVTPHQHRAAIHPLVALPSPELGAERLTAGAWFAVAGSDRAAMEVAEQVVADLGGRAFEVADADRAAYHAAAVIASNHVVALLGQAERVAASVGVPFEAYTDLVRSTLDNVAELGPAAALTGPAARGDQATIERHLAALDPAEREAYQAMADLAYRLAHRGSGDPGSSDPTATDL